VSTRIDPRVIEVYGRLWRYVIPYRFLGFIAVLGMVASSLVEGLLVWMLEPMTDEALVAHNLETAKWLPVAFVGVFIIRGVAGFATEASLGWIGRGVISSLRRDVFKKFLTLPSRFIEQNSTGPLLSRMTYNVEMISESVTHVVTTLIRDVLTIFAAAAVMLYQSPRLTVLVAIVFPLIALMIRALAKAFRRYSSRIQDSVGEVTQVTEEVLSGHRVVKIFGGYAYETERMFNADEKNRKQHLKLVQARSFGTALTQVIFGFSVALVIYFAGVESMENKLSPGKFISFFSAMMLMLQACAGSPT
jgi:subfamily B ATP-binding cassette protein MsbA